MSEAMSGNCPIGPLQLHTLNAERDECIWCGPNMLAWKPGRWVPLPDGIGSAWTTRPLDPPITAEAAREDEGDER